MVDQPDKNKDLPEDHSSQDEQPPKHAGWSPGQAPGWKEPPADDESSRPVVVNQWYTPAGADNMPAAEPESGTPVEDLPGTTPDKTGGWFTPFDAELEALLSGAASTIVEHPHTPASKPAESTQPQPAADTQKQATADTVEQAVESTQPQAIADTQEQVAADTVEQAVESTQPQAVADTQEQVAADTVDESTPASGSTPAEPSTGLSPAEAAFLAEQRAAGLIPSNDTPINLESPAEQAASQPVEQTAAQPTEQTAAQPAEQASAVPTRPTPYEQVERKVDVLRRRYQAGELTRDELQNELRNLMILGDDGHWWMLGLESNQWYKYDGRDWTPGIPPGYESQVAGSPVPTETDMQQVVIEPTPGTSSPYQIEIDEDGMPLPARVPQDDPGATLVSPSTPFMEPIRPSEAPTLNRTAQVGAETDTAGFVSQPMRPSQAGSQFTQPSRPVTDDQVTNVDQTIRSEPVQPDVTQRGIPVPAQAVPAAAGSASAQVGSAVVNKPKPRMGEFPQPDYSAALGIARNRNTYVKWGVRFAVFGIIGGMAISLLVLLLMVGYYFTKVNQYSNAVANLRDRAANFETTIIKDSKGATLAEFSDFSAANTGARTEVPLDQISPWLIDATIATENETFYTDPGFSVIAIVRATVQNVREGDTVSGASTITQQLARALVLETEFASQRTTERKIVEIIVASEIKRKYTKNEILEIYLNEIFYGNRAYGIEAASQTYFHKSASELNPAEAAFLAGLPQSPAQYDPIINREAALGRMHTVLRLMAEANGDGCVRIQHQDATGWAVPEGGALCVTAQTQPDGSVSYFYQTPNMAQPEDMVLDIANVEIAAYKAPTFEAMHPHFVNYVWQQLEDKYGSQAIYSAGFRVTTTLDERIQSAAENAVTNNLSNLQARGIDVENASVVAMRPTDGAVVAMVGSADYNNDQIDGQVNVALTAQQPGSSIKPLLYLASFMPDGGGNYFTPATVLWDVPTSYGTYVPLNYDRLFHGPETIRSALANSLNIPAVKTMDYVGLLRFTELATEMGLTFPLGNPVERDAGLPTALGAVEVRLFDMVRAYATLANSGRQVIPYTIVHIEDSKGNVVYDATPSAGGDQVVQPELAYLITSILSDNEARAAEFGRGAPLELTNGRIAAVKTGTTDDSRDIWTIGYTPQYTVGVWVGNTDNRPMYALTGYGGAAPIWNDIMEEAHTGLEVQQFAQPAGLVQVEVCDDSGAQPSADCAGHTHWEIFAANEPPPGPDKDIYRTLQVDGYTGKLANEYCQDDVEQRIFLAISDSTAYDWINNTSDGNAWAASRGVEVPVMPPPTEYCDPNQQRPNVVVSFPPDNMQNVEGVLPVRGTITMPDFSRYEVRIGVSHEPEAFSQPLEVIQTQQPNTDSPLAQIDTRELDNGPYTVRIVAIDNYGRSVTRDVRITVNNPEPTPAPMIPTPTLAPSPTAGPGIPAATPGGDTLPFTPTLAPTLTPTWTLTPTPQ